MEGSAAALATTSSIPVFSSTAASSSSSSSSLGLSVAVPYSSDGSPRNPALNAGLAREASALFNSARYNECIDLLHQILLSYHENPKVIHNIAVAEYFRDGCTDPQKLLHLLSKIKNKIEELCKTNMREQFVDTNISSSDSPRAAANKSGIKSSAAGMSFDTTSPLEDYDTSIPTFNSAVILFHLQQFSAALSVLEPLYHNIEVIDEPAALRICSLMLDTALASCQPRRASEVLRYMERVFGLGNLVTPSTDVGSNMHSQETLLSSTLDFGSNVGSTDMARSPSISNSVPEVSLTRSSSEEALDEEVLSLGGLDMEGGSTNPSKSGAPMPLVLSNAGRGGPDGISAAPQRDSSVKILLHLNKIHFFLCTRNLRASKKEVKLAMNLAQGGDHLKALMLKAQLEYLRGNHRKAIKLLMTCIVRDKVSRCTLLNNLGCIHHHLQKYSTASLYFKKALQFCTLTMSAKPLLVSAFSEDKSASVLYNCGLQQLTSGSPILAALYFQEAGRSYHSQPLFWLRLAECCILALEKGLVEAGGFDTAIKKEELRLMSLGDGRWRRLLLPAGSLNPSATRHTLGLEADDDVPIASSSPLLAERSGFSPGKPRKLTLVFARQCLQNAFHLVGKLIVHNPGAVDVEEAAISEDRKNLSLHGSKDSITGASQANLNGNSNKEGKVNCSNVILASVMAFEDDQQRWYSTMLQHVLADLAFVELCLENPVKALKITRQLLRRPDVARHFTFLSYVYTAEALCMLNRPQEAAMELSRCIAEFNNLPEMPVNGGDEDGQKCKSGENSEASIEGDEGGGTGTPYGSTTLSEALNISGFTGTRARASLFVNLAMVHVMLQDVSQAHHLAMQAVSITPGNPLAVLCLVYVSLVQGRKQEVVALLKHCRHLWVKSS